LREEALRFQPGGQMLLFLVGEEPIDFVVVRGALQGVVTKVFVGHFGPFAEEFVVLDLKLERFEFAAAFVFELFGGYEPEQLQLLLGIGPEFA
jgi:hypothetical protein